MYDILQFFFCVWGIFGTLPAFQEGYFDGFAEKNCPSKAWTEITFSLDPKSSTCKMFQRSCILNSRLFWRKPKGRWGCFSGANCFLFEFAKLSAEAETYRSRRGPSLEMCTWKQNERTVRLSLQSEGISLLEKWCAGLFEKICLMPGCFFGCRLCS